VANELQFLTRRGLYEFLLGFTAQDMVNRSGTAKFGNFSRSAFRRYRAMCGLVYYYYERLSNDTKTDDLERCTYVGI